MIQRIDELRAQAQGEIEAASSSEAVEALRVRYLGRKAELPQMLRSVATLAPEQRGAVGKAANEARRALEQAIEARAEALDASELEERLKADTVDVTLPGTPAQPVGRLHVLTATMRELEDIFLGLGFTVLEGQEVETVHYNFDALNHSPTHPARAKTDTFYVHRPGASGGEGNQTEGGLGGPEDVVLRTHTSPMQIRAMETQAPPIFIVVPGKVYRRDSDATHSPMFHQVEGLAIGEGITLADLQGTLLEMLRAIFGETRQARMRPHFFPFTEPSVEFDVSCFQCEGTGSLADGERCNLCKGIGWIEVGGAGMVDPNVLGFVEGNGYDAERVQGFAFGMGVERIAMLRHGVPDLRRFFDNDVRMLGQFL